VGKGNRRAGVSENVEKCKPSRGLLQIASGGAKLPNTGIRVTSGQKQGRINTIMRINTGFHWAYNQTASQTVRSNPRRRQFVVRQLANGRPSGLKYRTDLKTTVR